MVLRSLEDLLIWELEDLCGAEDQLLRALPEMLAQCASEKLQEAFEEYLQQTYQHRDRVQRILLQLGREPRGSPCKAMQGLLEEVQDLLREETDPAVRDAGMLAAAQRAEHYQIAAYGTARTYAEMLGHEEASALLQELLDEEAEANDLLTELAISEVNLDALKGVNSQRDRS